MKSNIDLPNELAGLVPSTQWKAEHTKEKKWFAGETISLGIGQGYNNFTVLQMASAMGTLANGGVKMKPHLVQKVMDVISHKQLETALHQVMGERIAKPENIAIIRNAMVGVNVEGTSAAAFRATPYTSGGKTGTAQVVTIAQGAKYKASEVEERHREPVAG